MLNQVIAPARIVAATSNDAYNTLVATDLAPEFGRDNVFQITRYKSENARHQLPRTLGGKPFGPELTHAELNRMLRDGWSFGITPLTEEYTFATWRAENPEAHLIGWLNPAGEIRLVRKDDDVKAGPDVRLLAFRPRSDGNGKA